ncbi:hypothetical protein HK102_010241, partial [Quaeritorhiza haematococci]
AARRAQCINNLKQIGLAMHNYHSALNSFPLGASLNPYTTNPNDLPMWNNWSAQALLLGYIEGGTIYSACNFSFAPEWANNYGFLANSTATYTKVNAFLCPSDGLTCLPQDGVVNTGTGRLGNNNYAGNTGRPRNILMPGQAPTGGNLPPHMGAISTSRMYNTVGPCSPAGRATNTNVNVSMASITDGTSNTAAASEFLMNDGTGNHRDPRRRFNYTDSALIEQIDVDIWAVVRDGLAGPARNWPDWTMYKGSTWAFTDGWEGHLYSHLFPPNAPTIHVYYSNTLRCFEGDTGANPSSNHPGGANVAFMDGSVRFIKNSVSLPTWWALGTRNGGEVISADAY